MGDSGGDSGEGGRGGAFALMTGKEQEMNGFSPLFFFFFFSTDMKCCLSTKMEGKRLYRRCVFCASFFFPGKNAVAAARWVGEGGIDAENFWTKKVL